MRWFRMHADAISNPKLKLLAFEDRWHFVAVCCMKAEGLLDEARDEQLRERLIAAQLGLTAREADEVRRRLNEVDLVGHDWQPKGWAKYQYSSDNSTDRVRKFREKQKRNSAKRGETVSVTPPDTDTETESDKKTPCAPEAHGDGLPDGFARFWKAYPRKENRKKALTAWKAKRLEAKADELVADVEARKARHRPWLEGVIPHATTYINGARWEDEIDETSRSNRGQGREGTSEYAQRMARWAGGAAT